MTEPPRPPGDPGSRRATALDLLWIGLLALAARAVYLVQYSTTPMSRHLVVDEAGYDRWARLIAGGQWLQDRPFYQAPLYPYALGLWYRLCGDSHLAVRIAQALAGIAAVLLLYLATRRLFGPRAARCTGALAALYVPFVFTEAMLLKEAWAILLTSLLLLLLLRVEESGRGALAAGLVLGLLCLLRENALLYVPLLALWLGLRARGEGGWGAPLRAPALLAAGTALALLPAVAHNLVVGGGLLLTTSQAGANFYIGNHRGALGVYEPLRRGRETPEFEGTDAREEASRRAGRPLSPAEASRFWLGEGLRFAREHPGEFASLQARKLLLTLHDREIPDAWDLEFVAHEVPFLRWPLPRFGWIAPLALLGVVLAWPWRRGAALLACLALATLLSISAFYVFARYRLPLAVFLLPFAGVTLARAIEACRGLRGRELALGAALLVPAWLLVHLDLARLGLTFTDEVGLRNVALLQVEEGRLDLAAEGLERAVATNPDFADGWLSWARVEQERGDLASQRQVLERLVAHATTRAAQGTAVLDAAQEAAARSALGDLLRRGGDLPGALACFERAAALIPADPGPPIQAGITLRLLGRLAEARAAHLEALRRDPGNPVALVNLANVEEDRGDLAAAVARLEQAAAECALRRPDLCEIIAAQRERVMATLASLPPSR